MKFSELDEQRKIAEIRQSVLIMIEKILSDDKIANEYLGPEKAASVLSNKDKFISKHCLPSCRRCVDIKIINSPLPPELDVLIERAQDELNSKSF